LNLVRVTKKTGIEVAYVAHNGDEFEPFSEIMGQADGRTPVGVGRRGRKSAVLEEECSTGGRVQYGRKMRTRMRMGR